MEAPQVNSDAVRRTRQRFRIPPPTRMTRLVALPVLAAGIYFVGLGIAAIAWPERVRRFLASHASSASAHFTELCLRLIVGSALVLWAPRMQFSPAFLVFGWVLVGTTIALFLVPWRLHRRFAEWSVPMAARRPALLGVGALVGGVLLLLALLLPRGAV